MSRLLQRHHAQVLPAVRRGGERHDVAELDGLRGAARGAAHDGAVVAEARVVGAVQRKGALRVGRAAVRVHRH